VGYGLIDTGPPQSLVDCGMIQTAAGQPEGDRLVEIARDLARTALEFGTRTDIHIMLDTGMGRIGVWHENCLPFLEEVSRIQGIRMKAWLLTLPPLMILIIRLPSISLQCFLKSWRTRGSKGLISRLSISLIAGRCWA